ncbi:unnamed protein product [Calypogeia fissa]
MAMALASAGIRTIGISQAVHLNACQCRPRHHDATRDSSSFATLGHRGVVQDACSFSNGLRRGVTGFEWRQRQILVCRLKAVPEAVVGTTADPETKPSRQPRRSPAKRKTATTKTATAKKVSADEKENEVKAPEMILGSDGEEEDEDVTDWPPLVCCFGEALYEFLPSVRVSKIQQHPDIYSTWKGLQWSPPEWARLPGSFPHNVAVALARLGGRVAFMGKVGDDDHGQNIVLLLNKNGVQTRAVKFDSSCSTGVSRLRLTNGEGHVRMTCVRPSAEDSFVKSELNMDVLKESRFFQFTSFSLTSEPIRSTLFAAIKEAKRNDADIVFDVNLPLRYWRSVQDTRELIKAAWKESTIVEVTKHELEFILGEKYYEELRESGPQYFSTSIEQTKNRRYHYHYEPAEIAPLWHKKMKILFVTDGTFWIHYYTPTFHGKVAGTEDVLVTPFTCDRTGSGDAVMAAILRKLSTQPELLQDEVKLQKALRFCLCAGIIAQWTKGAIRGMPTESATQNLTEQVYPGHMVF